MGLRSVCHPLPALITGCIKIITGKSDFTLHLKVRVWWKLVHLMCRSTTTEGKGVNCKLAGEKIVYGESGHSNHLNMFRKCFLQGVHRVALSCCLLSHLDNRWCRFIKKYYTTLLGVWSSNEPISCSLLTLWDVYLLLIISCCQCWCCPSVWVWSCLGHFQTALDWSQIYYRLGFIFWN